MNKYLVIILFFFLFLICTPTVQAASTHYVDATGGNDQNDGLAPERAWKTISKVNSYTPAPGDSILFKRGQVWKATSTSQSGSQLGLTPNASGTAGNPITYGAYGTGNVPIISSALTVPNWSNVSGNVYSSATGYDPVRVLAWTKNGQTILLHHNTGALSAVGLNEWDYGSGTLYINVGENPANGLIEAGRNDQDMFINTKSYINISDIQFEKGNSFGIYLYHADHINLTNVSCKYSGAIGMVVLGVSYLNINGGSFSYNKNDGIYIMDLTNNVNISDITASYNQGIETGGDQDGVGVGGDVAHCTNIEFHRVRAEGNFGAGVACWLSDHMSIYDSYMANNGHPISNPNNIAYIRCTDGTIQRNTLVGAQEGIGIHSGNFRNFNISGNLVMDSGFAGIYVDATTDAGTIDIINNTVYRAKDGIYINSGLVAGQVNLKNNIVYTDPTVSGYALQAWPSTLINSDNNIFYSNGSKSNFIRWGATTYSSSQWANYRTASGQDAHSYNIDPLFVNPTGGNFSLQAGSPAVDKGTNVGLTVDLAGINIPQGNAPDIGALEYTNQVTPSPTPTPTPTTQPSPSPTPAAIPGDTNGDGKVDGIDYVTVVIHFGQNSSIGPSGGDLNLDGKVDISDLNVVISNIH